MSKFKNGDRVKVVASVHAYTRSVGRVGTVSLTENSSIYRVTFDEAIDGDWSDTAYASDLQLLVEEGPAKSVKEQIEAIEAALAALKSTIGL